jgi:hypothetical protein
MVKVLKSKNAGFCIARLKGGGYWMIRYNNYTKLQLQKMCTKITGLKLIKTTLIFIFPKDGREPL